ncbi:MAG TPA: tripartite tricarboxylate transporter substrate binding protein, partial [Beijerinckiaceae bacterium]|nr:tripartite tricarboxylate transporter substrate binding protein [Beijerinckiaceae bacterium]
DRRRTLFEAAQRTMAKPEVQEAMKARGITPVWDKPGEFESYVKDFVARGTAVLKELGPTKE